MSEFRTFRSRIIQRVPRWLRGRNMSRVLYAIGAQCDALVDMTTAAVRYRHPGLYGPESLSFIGHDRKIPRGPNNSNAAYADRLVGWLETHRHRGNPLELLRAVRAYYAPNTFPLDLIYAGSPLLSYTLRFHMTAEGIITRHRLPRTEWTPHGDEEQWARWWLFFHNPDFAVPDYWDQEGLWGDGGVWGLGLSAGQVAEIQIVPRIWNAGRSIGRCVFLAEGEDWDTHAPGTWPFQAFV